MDCAQLARLSLGIKLHPGLFQNPRFQLFMVHAQQVQGTHAVMLFSGGAGLVPLYLTINALMAADALIMPLVPESLDFMSSVSFWNLFSDISRTFLDRGEDKSYDFISVLLSRVDYGPASSSAVVRSWAQRAYQDWMHTVEIPMSSVVSSSGLALSTVFDMSRGEVPEKSLARARDPMVQYCRWVDEQYTAHWDATQ